MTHKPNKVSKTAFGVYLLVNSNTALSIGDAIPYTISAGTSSHGVTVSNGVVTLPKGDWLISFTADSTSTFEGQIYVDSSANTTFPLIQSLASTANSNLDSTVIPLESDGTTTVEVRVDSATIINAGSDCLIYGFKL